jgi:rhomboid protease GluP
MNEGGLNILDRIIFGLRQEGWQIDKQSDNWIIARKGKEGLLFTSLIQGNSLIPPKQPFLEDLSILHWEAFIFCSEGLSSSDLQQPILKKVQSWFVDLQTGSIFLYPPSEKKKTLHQVLSYLEHPNTSSEVTSISEDSLTERSSKSSTHRLREHPYLTYVLILLNLILFLLMTLAGGSTKTSVLIQFGAKVNSLILQGEVWRFFTSMFLHIGFLHLAFNLYALWALGPITETLIGRTRYLIIYILCGISGSIASFLFTDALSAGASGAIFGLLGALVSHTRKSPGLWKSGFGKNLIIIIFINLSLGFFQPGIDIYAHIGGLICGLILGRLFP